MNHYHLNSLLQSTPRASRRCAVLLMLELPPFGPEGPAWSPPFLLNRPLNMVPREQKLSRRQRPMGIDWTLEGRHIIGENVGCVHAVVCVCVYKRKS
jgi:hypothetical protein